MQTDQKDYVTSVETDLPFAEAVHRVRELLREADYGVLCGMDVKAKLKEKLGLECEPYMILGTCNPPLASEDLERELGALFPCNVVVYERGGRTRVARVSHARRTRVAAVEPRRLLSIVGNEELGPIASRVREDLGRVVAEVAEG